MKNNLESLLARNPDTIGNAALQTALAAHRAEQSKKEADRALALVREAQVQIDSKVANVRAIRAREKVAKEELSKLNTALEAFVKDGNGEALTLAMRGARGF